MDDPSLILWIHRWHGCVGVLQVVQLQLEYRNPCRLWCESSSIRRFDVLY